MMTLHFADTHNLVAFFAKPAESEGFEQIVDFLNASSKRYALTVNPTIYTSCIEQFWAIVKVKTVNGEQQLQALVDGNKIIITEASVRRDLQLEDADGVDCLPNATIFKQLTLMGAKTTAWNEFNITMASAIICLATNQKFNFSKYIFESMVKNLDNAVKFLMYPMFVQAFLNNQLEGMATHNMIYILPSHTKKIFANMIRQGKDFSGRETPLFPTMVVSQSSVPSNPTNIADEAVTKEPSMQLKELMDLYTKLQQRVLDLENTKTAQAQEITRGEINDIDKDAKITLVDETQGRYGDEDMFVIYDLNGDEVVVKSEVTDKASEKRNIVKEAVVVTDAVTIPVSVATITNVELTLAQTIAELKSAIPKTKEVVMQEPSESTPTISLQLPSQAQEQQELIIEEKSTLFVQLLEKIKKHFPAKRAEEKRNRPPTRAQQRSIMCTYLKNMTGYKPKDLKNKTEFVKGTEMEESSKKAEVIEESSSKRAGDELQQESTKKQKMDDDQERAKLQTFMQDIHIL
ncbi:hypothetical protein Tco_1398459 [Tanacetum coccineum]